MGDRDAPRGPRGYFRLEGAPSSALTFASPDASAVAAIRAVAESLPVRPYRASVTTDRWVDATAVGDLDTVFALLEDALARDHLENLRSAGTVLSELVLTEMPLNPDALHVITRLRPRSGSHETISYGARLQRVEQQTWALWSDY
jgi:hypothetical protein